MGIYILDHDQCIVNIGAKATPEYDPLPIPKIKTHLDIQHQEHDDLLTQIRADVIDLFERYTNVVLARSAYTVTLDSSTLSFLHSSKAYLPLMPVVDITSISVADKDGGSISIAADKYLLQSDRSGHGIITFLSHKTLPDFGNAREGLSVVIVGNAGYNTASPVPATAVGAMLSMCAQGFMHRGANELSLRQENMVRVVHGYNERLNSFVLNNW